MFKAFSWVSDFVNSFNDTDNLDPNAQYHKHIGYIRLLAILAIFLGLMGRFIGEPNQLTALHVPVTANGVPVKFEDLTRERDESDITEFAAKVARMTFNLDSYSTYKQYRNQLNYVNSRFYRLSWDTLNISEAEYTSGRISDGDKSYYLVGQELVAVIIRSGIYRMLVERERKFWLDISEVKVTSTSACLVPEECYEPTRGWNVQILGNLNMVTLDERNSKPRYVPLSISLRVSAVGRMRAPDDGLMIERIAAVIGNKK